MHISQRILESIGEPDQMPVVEFSAFSKVYFAFPELPMFVPIFSGITFRVWMMSAALYWSVDSVAATGRDKRIKSNQHNFVFLSR